MTLSLKSVSSWAVLLLILMQFIPLNRINPRISSDIETPNIIKQSLKKACYDCHSNETRWPTFAYIAPISWLLSSKVSAGRNVLNFSRWNNENNAQLHNQKTSISRIFAEGTLHQPLYYLWNRDAQLNERETKIVMDWLKNSFNKQSFPLKNSENNREGKTL